MRKWFDLFIVSSKGRFNPITLDHYLFEKKSSLSRLGGEVEIGTGVELIAHYLLNEKYRFFIYRGLSESFEANK